MTTKYIKTSTGHVPMTLQQRKAIIYDCIMLGYTVPQAADYLGVSAATVRRYLRSMPRTKGRVDAWELSPDAYKCWT